VPLTQGQTIELDDGTLVVILGIRDVLPAFTGPDGVETWAQVVFVGTYEESLDEPVTFRAAGTETRLASTGALVG
jgi:hypothetical protein